MTKTRKSWLSFIALSLAAILATLAVPLLNPIPALASEPTRFQNVSLAIYPEYDDLAGIGSPSVLVMLDGQIEGATPPTTVRFLVPTSAVMYSAGSGPRSQYQGGPPTRKASATPGWDEISFDIKTTSFVVDYYVPIDTSPNRSFTAAFIPEYPIDGLSVVVQQPTKSTNFSVTPGVQPASQQNANSQGFNEVDYTYTTVNAQQNLSFALSYTRNTLVPSTGATSSGSTNTPVVVIIVLAAVVLIGFVLYWVLGKKPAPRKRGRDRAAGKGRGGGKASPGERFCAKCDARMDKSARFCPECGAKQRP